MIRDFGGTAIVDAHEAAAACAADDDKDGEAFYLAVVRKIQEFYGR